MSLMTREDMLRELELSPMWQLRALTPLEIKAEIHAKITEPEQKIIVELETEVEEKVQKAVEHVPEVLNLNIYSHIVSEDGAWLFILPEFTLHSDEEHLFQNICKAIRIKAKPAEMSDNTAEVIKTIQPKLLVVMGQMIAQSILQTTEPLDSLRKTRQRFQGVALIATYDLAHLLRNLQDKAKTWDDLCIAMQFLQSSEM